MQCRTVGVRLGAGESLHDILSSSRQVAEGVSTAGQSDASHFCVCGVSIIHKHRPATRLLLLLLLVLMSACGSSASSWAVHSNFAAVMLCLIVYMHVPSMTKQSSMLSHV